MVVADPGLVKGMPVSTYHSSAATIEIASAIREFGRFLSPNFGQ